MSAKDETPALNLDVETITVTLLRGRNFRGNKGEFLGHIMIKANYCEKTFGEANKFDCSNESDIEFNYSFSLLCPCSDAYAIDEYAYRPVVITFIKMITKDKKKKDEEKTITIGQCTVDLLPIIKGETNHETTIELVSIPGSVLESFLPDVPKPEIDVCISISKSLLDREEVAGYNIMTITIESLNSPPETLVLQNHVLTAAMSVPIINNKENILVFVGTQHRSPADKEPLCKQKKWVNPLPAVGNAVYIPNSYLFSDPKDNEDGDFRSKENREYRKHSELERPKFIWNMERRCFLHQTGSKHLLETITTKRYLPLEILRISVPSGGRVKKHEDEGTASFHGVVYIDASPLLYPGVKQIKGAYKVQPFSECEYQERAISSTALSEEAIKFSLSFVSSGPSPTGRKVREDKKEPKKTALKPNPENTSDVDLHTANAEGQLFVEARSYVVLSISLERPLIAKKTAAELSHMVETYIPPRPMFPKRLGGTERAVSDFHKQIECVTEQVLDEFRHQFKDEIDTDKKPNEDEMEERKQRLLFHLNTSGKYFTYKERLKHAVVKIVREKYLKTNDFDDKEKLQEFLSELYIFLVDEMNIAINKFLNIQDQPSVPEPLADTIQLKQFAEEAEMNGNMTLASKYHEECIIKDRNHPQHWIDYAIFCLGCLDYDKAEQCARECIAIDQQNHDGLLLVGILSGFKNLYEVGETFFEAALSIYPESILGWTLLGLLYDGAANEMRAEMAFHEAERLNIAQTVAEAHKKKVENEPNGEEESQQSSLNDKEEAVAEEPKFERQNSNKFLGIRPDIRIKSDMSNLSQIEEEYLPSHEPEPEFSIYMITAEWLIKFKVFRLAERALAHELLQSSEKPSIQYFWCLAKMSIFKKEFTEAENYLNEALMISQEYPETWALLGHVKYLTGDVSKSQNHYERTLAFVNDTQDIHSVFLRLGSIYLQDKKFPEARDIFLMACKGSPSSVTWLGVAIACYRMDMLYEAESALCEANILNNMDPEIWAYLALVCLKHKRIYEAEQSFKYSIKLGLNDKEILQEILHLQETTEIGNTSFHSKENILSKGE
ncbi:cilia- and flagella-associated protein 70 [Octopus bimaculoides]|uniref:Cilia- and flagella-associated protein 70 n=1 Tax=Octopus bimaculoides TaxID=37653 RepID=A0A0L8I9G5_OCTBM|nr:cilia- and flagella-associated protein 70 [Octopus bimaculoides]XP_014787512.1 cilia- and flagella-associated protein 70 [Octopus bimaculoides]|eukprot:XP_014787504.1 PREDICTED: cilia- and flagella-associated protein 70-like [Octopus bimaculoides]